MLHVDVALSHGGFSLNASFCAGAGITVLFGRSGSGKTTLVNAIAGLARPARGRITVGEDVLFDSSAGVDVPVHARRIGYVFQDARLFPHLDVRRNLLYGHRLGPPGPRPIGLDQVVELMGLATLLDRRPGKLSGGERQRVAIGRALLSNPRMLLMDEPLASLDNLRKAEILRYIERLRDDLAIPIVYVSHALEEVTRLAATLVLVSDGRIVAAGPLAEVMNRAELRPHVGRFEAGSVIETRVVEQDMHYDLATLEFPGGRLYATNVDALLGETVRVRIRARDVALSTREPDAVSMLNVLPGEVESMDPAGEPLVDVRVLIGQVPVVARITRYSCDRLGIAPGRKVYVLIKSVSLDRHATGYA
jgi:molybdate transport system ATP-binding protein